MKAALRRGYLKILLLWLVSVQLNAQVTTEGTDFWLGFMENADDGNSPSSLEIFITSKFEAEVQIFVLQDGKQITVSVSPGITHREVVSVSNLNPYAASGSDVIEKKAIHIISNEDISVYAFNNRSASADATVVLPYNSLGNSYYVSSYFEEASGNDLWGANGSPSEFLIVATEDNTQLRIVTSTQAFAKNSGFREKGIPYIITLNQGEVYQLQASGDLTGTFIETVSDDSKCGKFAVFGGNRWTRVTGGKDCAAMVTQRGVRSEASGGYAGDHLYEQIYPISTWGKNYMVLPFESRSGYVLQITASENTTTVKVGTKTYHLNAGDFIRTEHGDYALSVMSNKPVQVAQLAQSLSCDFPSGVSDPMGPGDPMMIMLSPIEQKLKEITFNALSASAITTYYVSVITETEHVNELEINGVSPSSISFQLFSDNPTFSYLSIPLSKSLDYTLKSETGFVAYVYGFGQIESFGYVAGASLENLNAQLILEDQYVDIIVDEGCVNSDINFDVEFDVTNGEQPRYTQFDWHFDDGQMASGQQTSHVYAEPGDYTITLIASNGTGNCGTSETFVRQVSILEVEADEIQGSVSVCPEVDGVEYTVTGAAENTYEWFVSEGDGSIASGQGSETVAVNWGLPNDNAFLKVVPKNALGCVGDTLILPVKINKKLEPITPIGTANICFIDVDSPVSYITYPTKGSVYIWEVEGGEFVPAGANTGSEVQVKWDGVGTGQLRYLESNLEIEDCDGYSDYLEVTVYQEIKANATISNVLCNARADGAIQLTITGGKRGNYTAQWDNGMSGLSISNLKAGTYEATISDAAGCEITESYTVTEPEELIINDANILDVRCFQEANGSIQLAIQGGTPDGNGKYTVHVLGNGIDRTSNENQINDLPTGTYEVTVTDSNGCNFKETYQINEPLLLEPDLETFINEPICPQASNGITFIEAKGGTPDYQFYWSNNTALNNQEGTGFSQGSYTLRIVDSNGCETTMDFKVEERFPKIFIPNAFSPNGDGANEEFKPVTDCNLLYNLQVYNQWGSVIFATEDITEGWDGTYKGAPVPDGQYSYVMFYAGALNGVSFEETQRGSVKLIR